MKKFFGWVGVFVIMASLLVNVQSASAGDVVLDTTFNSVGYVTHGNAAGGDNVDIGESLQIQTDGKYVVTGLSNVGLWSDDMVIWRYNANGSLDTTFNSVGYVTHNSAAGGNGDDEGESLQIQTDGKYVVAGYSKNVAGDYDMTIWRYNTDGSLDTTFNSVGYVTHNNAAGGNGDDKGHSLQIQTDGKYVVTGESRSAGTYADMTIWRYNTDGSLDTTFNSVGYVTHAGAAGGTGYDSGNSLQIQTDGKYIVTGDSITAAINSEMVIWRYNTNGSLDTTFNSVGYVTHTAGNVGYSLKVQTDGKYVVSGVDILTGNINMVIWRYNANGSLDTTFNSVGYVTYDGTAGGNNHDRGYSLQIQEDGKYAVAGYTNTVGGKFGMAIWRYNTDGSLDTTFNSVGYVTHNGELGESSYAQGRSLQIQTDGKYVVSGESITAAGNYDMTIWRLEEDSIGLKNTLDNSAPGELVSMTVEYTPTLTDAVTDGSVKLTLADEFDFNGISKADVSASGGDVTWSTDEIITVDGSIIAKNNGWMDKAYAQGEDSIVFGFTGDLDNTDGTITFTINGATAPLNPGTLGSYDFNIGVFSTSNGTGAALEVINGKVAIVSQVNVSATVPSSLTLAIDGVTSGNACANGGGNADITTTSTTVPFGLYTGAETKIGCQTLTVSTNATSGFVVTMEQDQDLTSAGSDTMKKYSGTYATPTIWGSPPGSGTESYFGFTTDDTDYSVFQTSKYSGVAANETPYSIMTEDGPVSDEVNVVSYQLEVTGLQEAGTYSNTVMYIATATF